MEGKNLCKRGSFRGGSQHLQGLTVERKDFRSQNKVAKVVHNRLIVYEKESRKVPSSYK